MWELLVQILLEYLQERSLFNTSPSLARTSQWSRCRRNPVPIRRGPEVLIHSLLLRWALLLSLGFEWAREKAPESSQKWSCEGILRCSAFRSLSCSGSVQALHSSRKESHALAFTFPCSLLKQCETPWPTILNLYWQKDCNINRTFITSIGNLFCCVIICKVLLPPFCTGKYA